MNVIVNEKVVIDVVDKMLQITEKYPEENYVVWIHKFCQYYHLIADKKKFVEFNKINFIMNFPTIDEHHKAIENVQQRMHQPHPVFVNIFNGWLKVAEYNEVFTSGINKELGKDDYIMKLNDILDYLKYPKKSMLDRYLEKDEEVIYSAKFFSPETFGFRDNLLYAQNLKVLYRQKLDDEESIQKAIDYINSIDEKDINNTIEIGMGTGTDEDIDKKYCIGLDKYTNTMYVMC